MAGVANVGEACAMTTSREAHSTFSDARFFLLLTAAHAALAFPALWVWAEVCERARRPR
jgi:hypothetical protein